MFTLSTEETAEFSAFAELSAKQQLLSAPVSISADPRRNAARRGYSAKTSGGLRAVFVSVIPQTIRT
jgi:hypothetical protein